MNAGKPSRNVTLSLPSDLLRKAKIIAAERGTSVSALLKDALQEVVARDGGYAAARRRSLSRLAEGSDLGTRGRPRWSREELHGR